MTPPASNPGAARTLVLLRHGKSAYPPGVADHERPLATRGRREAALAGEWISHHLPRVDLVLCSTAERTRQTLEATGVGGSSVRVDYPPDVYDADCTELLDLVRTVDPADRTLMIVGHSPGIPQLAEELAGPTSDRQALSDLRTKFPTSALAVLEVNGPWAEVDNHTTRLVRFVVPRA